MADLDKSVFIETFSKPINNSKSLPMIYLGEFGSLGRGGVKHRPRNAPELLGGNQLLIQTREISNSGRYITVYTSTHSDISLAQSKV